MPVERFDVIGKTISHYRITGKLGRGGMGEVYRARDTKLARDVAIKILPDVFAHDTDRVARFTREAQALAALNHPNIAQIYGIIETPDSPDAEAGVTHVHALVMELVEGEDLAQRLAHGAVPLDEALPIAQQIAEALEAAHDAGIVHRDLKPANIKVRPDGTVKILDFGLAKAMDSASVPGTEDPTNSPTLSAHATQMGVILGTAAYMAPEQARGKAADRRTDIWAFGAVLYEMLVGRPLFAGATVTEVLASVLRSDIDWGTLPPSAPASVRRLLRHCLERDPKRRLSAVGDARFDLDEAESAPVPSVAEAGTVQAALRPPWWKRVVPMLLVGVVASVATGTIVWNARPKFTPEVARFTVSLGSYQVEAQLAYNVVAISPDGRRLAYVVDRQLVLKNLSEIEGRPISGSADTQAIFEPAFSPDGESIAYYALGERAIRRIPVEGGSPLTLCSIESPLGLDWKGDSLYFGVSAGLMRLPASGGTPEMLVPVRPGDSDRFFGPQLLPGGKALLFTSAAGGDFAGGGKIVVQSLLSGERSVVVDGGTDARYLSSGHILYVKGGIAYAVGFDATTMKAHGTPVNVIEGVRLSSDSAHMYLSVSDTGTVVYVPGPTSGNDLKLAFFGQSGAVEPLAVPAGKYAEPRLSPDGTRVAMSKAEPGGISIWVADVSGATAPRQLTFEGISRYPVWSPDGQRVTFQSQLGDEQGVFWKSADGAGPPEQLIRAEKGASSIPQSWSPDGRQLLYDVVRDQAVSLWAYSVQDRTSRRVPTENSTVPTTAAFSPDGRWIAYSVRESNLANARIYVQPFPATGAKYLISDQNDDGHHPVWSRDGRELFYTPGPGSRIQKVRISTAPSFQFSRPETLVRRFTNASPAFQRTYDVTKDGRFLGLIGAGVVKESGVQTSQVVVALNWFEELKRLVPTR